MGMTDEERGEQWRHDCDINIGALLAELEACRLVAEEAARWREHTCPRGADCEPCHRLDAKIAMYKKRKQERENERANG